MLLLGVLLFPTAAAVGLRGVLACCCKPTAGASCPMKHQAAKACAKNGAGSCAMRRAEPMATASPILGAPRQAVLRDRIEPPVRIARAGYGAASFRFATRVLQAPEPPPPKRA